MFIIEELKDRAYMQNSWWQKLEFFVIFSRGSISGDNFETVGAIKCEVEKEGWEKLILDKKEEKDQGNLFETFWQNEKVETIFTHVQMWPKCS